MSKAQVIHKKGPPSCMNWEDWQVPDPGLVLVAINRRLINRRAIRNDDQDFAPFRALRRSARRPVQRLTVNIFLEDRRRQYRAYAVPRAPKREVRCAAENLVLRERRISAFAIAARAKGRSVCTSMV